MVVEGLYAELYHRKVVTLDEVHQASEKLTGKTLSRQYVGVKYLDRLIRSGKLVRIRRGLYATSPPGGGVAVDKLLLASKIRERGFLGYHSALEFYGCAYSALSEAYVCVEPKDRFNGFSFGGFAFKPVYVDDADFEVMERDYQAGKVRVPGRERLLVDCVSRPKYAGGWEECLKSLEGLGGVDFARVAELLEGGYGGQVAVRRTGLVLELLRASSAFYRHLSEETLVRVERLVGPGRMYLNRGEPGRLAKRWGLIVPEGFAGLLRAV